MTVPQTTTPQRKTPCKDCDASVVGCHAKCAKYLDWAAQKRAANQKAVNDRQIDVQAQELERKSYRRALQGFKP